MARWRDNGDGLRWLEGWATEEELRRYAAALGHEMAWWHHLVDAGPYWHRLGICQRCGLRAGYGLLYRGKVAESIADEPTDVGTWRKLYRGKHRKPIGVMWGPALTTPCRPLMGRD